MKTNSQVGIYIGGDSATVVCLDGDGRIVCCTSVNVEAQQEQKQQALASMIAQRCTEKNIDFSEASVAISCSMYLQHSIHSAFKDARKISQTVRFDVEEALTTDVSNVAIAFRPDRTTDAGTQLTVFTAQKEAMAELISALEASRIGAVTIEPDINCLARFICRNSTVEGDVRPFFALLGHTNGYFLIPLGRWGKTAATGMYMRSMLLSAAADKTKFLAAQIPLTVATVTAETPVNQLRAFDSSGRIDTASLAKTVGLEGEAINVPALAGASPEAMADCPDVMAFAIAWGAAAARLEKPANMNFRSDFMPYQGKRMLLENTLKFLSAAVVVLLIAAGIYGLLHVWQVRRFRTSLKEKLSKDYTAVMFGQKLDGSVKKGADALAQQLRKVRSQKEGPQALVGEEAVSARLTLVLEALNKYARQTGVNVETITVTGDTISVSGDTIASNNANTLRIFDAFKEAGLNIMQQQLSSKGGRDTFTVTAEPGK